jgi:hypothetical protein
MTGDIDLKFQPAAEGKLAESQYIKFQPAAEGKLAESQYI